MRILSVILFMQIEQVTLFGCLRGAGDTRFTALVSLISVTFIRPGMSWLLCYPLGPVSYTHLASHRFHRGSLSEKGM